jgi:hypothetical protein
MSSPGDGDEERGRILTQAPATLEHHANVQRRFGFTWCTFRVWRSICVCVTWALGIADTDTATAWGGERNASVKG